YVATENEHLITKRNPSTSGNIMPIRDFCLNHNVKAEIKDIRTYVTLMGEMRDYIGVSDAETRLHDYIQNSAASTIAEFRDGLAKKVHEEFSLFLTDMHEDTNYLLEALDRVYSLSIAYKDKQKEIEVKQVQNGTESKQEDVTIQGVDLVSDNLPITAIIRIETNGFNTMPYREKSREYSDEIQNETKYEKPSHWLKYNRNKFSGASACWNKDIKQWEIPYGAWLLFKERDSDLTDACTFKVIFGEIVE
ncbi:MAG: hypothetical protein I4N51_01530, partial [Acinetobacter sp.]|nr:hypothetical protein [Acinetobacter sp.]